MDAVEALLLFDHYGDLLTERQRVCLDLKYNQDMSLAEIAEELGVSRQGVHENILRAESRLQRMEEKTGAVRRYLKSLEARQKLLEIARTLVRHEDPAVRKAAEELLAAVRSIGD